MDPSLRRLARMAGIQLSYTDATGRARHASRAAVEATLSALLGHQIDGPAADAAQMDAGRRGRLIEPVTVAWQPGRSHVRIQLPPRAARVDCEIECEDGSARAWRVAATGASIDLALPPLDAGYHRLHVSASRRQASTLIISAPIRAYVDASRRRDWGVFLPLYALHSRHSWGAGDFSDLMRLARWVESRGGRTVATLPLLAQFYEEGLFEPSPYSPASRLMWNELYIDAESLGNSREPVEGRDPTASDGFRQDIAVLRSQALVDYPLLAGLKRSALRALSDSLSRDGDDKLTRFLAERPLVAEYARFRARTERHGPWPRWSSDSPDFEPGFAHYHEYAQWLADGQLRDVSQSSKAGLYLDLPLGVHGAGFDTWRWPQSFVRGLSAGAPPDAFFAGGQDWGFPPLHPAANRDNGYEYVIACIRHHLRYARRLRIDHVMGLHRLFVIPEGFEALDGVYVRYPAEEMYAILCLESHRHRAEIAGENLGIVPRYVKQAMQRHGLAGMYVLPFQIGNRNSTIRLPDPSAVASLNTHDLPTFAAWWAGDDIDQREGSGQLSAADAADERAARRQERESASRFLSGQGLLSPIAARSTEEARRAMVRFLGESPARLVLVNLEDLWGETEPQNVPGASSERPNWRRKARLSLEEMEGSASVAGALRDLNEARRAPLS